MNGQTAAALADLLHADQALIGMYREASARVSADTASAIAEAIDDHRQHEQLLSEALADAEMQNYDASDELQALLTEATRQVTQAREEREVLNALIIAEQLNAMLYETAQREELPEELADLLAEQQADERLHVSLIAERTPLLSSGSDHNLACMTGGLTDDKNPDDFD